MVRAGGRAVGEISVQTLVSETSLHRLGRWGRLEMVVEPAVILCWLSTPLPRLRQDCGRGPGRVGSWL
jgi:hypothetical protein